MSAYEISIFLLILFFRKRLFSQLRSLLKNASVKCQFEAFIVSFGKIVHHPFCKFGN